MTISKATISEDSSISFDCPKCRQHIQVPLSRIGHKYHCKVKCSCDNVFVAEIEFREKIRKQVDLAGHYEIGGPRKKKGNSDNRQAPENCRIIDISRSGIGFLRNDGQTLQPRDIILLNFRLDNSAGTEINQECEVIHVKDNFVGCRMLTENASLGFYLLG